MTLTPEAVANRRFLVTKWREGYDTEQVDAFLREVRTELIRLNTENAELLSRLGDAAPTDGPAGPQPVDAPAAGVRPPQDDVRPGGQVALQPDGTVSTGETIGSNEAAAAALRTLQMAQRMAEEVVGDARAEAERVIATAHDAAVRVDMETRERRAAALTTIEHQRVELQEQVEQLRSFEREYRLRLRGYFEAQLEHLTSRGDSLTPLAPGETPGLGTSSPDGASNGPASVNGGSTAALPPGASSPVDAERSS